MKEATGNALVMTMMASIIAIIMIFFVGSISYSKSYRLKNYIINQTKKWLEENNVNCEVLENGMKEKRSNKIIIVKNIVVFSCNYFIMIF